MSHLRQLHAASLPFVARALRGGRRLRYALGALLLSVLTVVLGFWIALGPGRLEHELRSGFNLEPSMYTQEMVDYKVFADDAQEVAELTRDIKALRAPDMLRLVAADRVSHQHDWRAVNAIESGIEALEFAANAPTYDRLQSDLQRRARTMLGELDLPQGHRVDWMYWHDPDHVGRVRAVLDSRLTPTVTVYSSPLGVSDAIRLTGLFAGGILLCLLLLFAPVLAGTQMAQEVHENTLQPLTGTALNSRDLVLGMTAGPLVIVGLLAAPQVVLLLGAALAGGAVLPALGMLTAALAGALFLTMLAQLAGLALGRQRTPGIIGVALLGALVPLTMLGAALALELPSRAVGMLALLPQAGSSFLLFESLSLPLVENDPYYTGVMHSLVADAHFATAVGAIGMLCFAFLGLRALERRVGDLAPTALTRVEATVGALVSTVLIILANPWRSNPAEFYLLNLVLVSVPLGILLMMRVPQVDVPLAHRQIPVVGLLGEFATNVGLFLAISVGIMGLDRLTILDSPVALAYTAWTIAVAGLIAIRVAALPLKLLSKVWLAVCMIGLGAAFIHAVEWARRPSHGAEDIFALWQVSPLLGVVQIALLIAIPVTLVRALRNPASAA